MSGAREACCHVLHVEDDADDAITVARMPGRHRRDIRLTCVRDGESVLEYLRDSAHEQSVDVMLLDLKRPRMQGTDLLRTIRSDRALENLPVIMLPSSQDHIPIDRCHEPGIDGLLARDDDAVVLTGKLDRFLGSWSQRTSSNVASDSATGPGSRRYTAGASSGLPRRSPDDPSSGGTSRILIVDDSTPDVAMMQRYLEGLEGTSIQTASESRKADAVLREESFDIILLDYRMPGMSGLDYLEVIRQRDPDVGVIMTTAFSDAEVAIASIRRRVDDFLRKEELTEENLIDAVERLLGRVQRRRSATIDAVTGLYCAGALKQRLSEACERLDEDGEEFCLIKLDLASFEWVNDQYGRATGDRVLRHVATRLPNTMRTGDFAARYRDDKFCVIAPATDEHKGSLLAERLRDSIRRIEFDYGDGRFGIECHVGVAHFREYNPGSADAVLHAAYTAMQEAKAAGSGKVRILRNHKNDAPAPD